MDSLTLVITGESREEVLFCYCLHGALALTTITQGVV